MNAHPLCLLLPPLPDHDYAALLTSIREQGLLRPITLYEGMILDGRHRHRACLEAGIDPTYETYTGSNPAAYVLGLHTQRALSIAQRALLADDLRAYEARAAREGSAKPTNGPAEHTNRIDDPTNGSAEPTNGSLPQMCGKAKSSNSLNDKDEGLLRRSKTVTRAPTSAQRAAVPLGVGARSIETVHAVRHKLVPEVLARAGELSVRQLSTLGTLQPEQQREIAALPKAEMRRAIAHDDGAPKASDPLDALRAELAEAQEAIRTLTVERDALKLETEGSAAAEILQLQQLLRTANQSRDHYMQQTAALRREVKALRRQLGR